MSVDVITTPRAVDVIGNITANWTFWQCRGHLKTHSKPALSLSLRVRRHSLPGEGKTFNCYGSSVYTSQSTGWDCVAWPGVYTLCASAFYTATSALTSRERTSSAHSNGKQGRRSCRENGERDKKCSSILSERVLAIPLIPILQQLLFSTAQLADACWIGSVLVHGVDSIHSSLCTSP